MSPSSFLDSVIMISGPEALKAASPLIMEEDGTLQEEILGIRSLPDKVCWLIYVNTVQNAHALKKILEEAKVEVW